MENASKALLIAGAILLVIAIIGIGMAIFGQAQGVLDTGANQIDALAVQTHNSMFDAYIDKTVKGKNIKELATKLASYNPGADTNYQVTMTLTGASETDVVLVNTTGLVAGTDGKTNLSTNITSTYNYEVTGDYDVGTGIITKIYVTKK